MSYKPLGRCLHGYGICVKCYTRKGMFRALLDLVKLYHTPEKKKHLNCNVCDIIKLARREKRALDSL